MKAIARAVRHAVSVAGIDHVGLSSDSDGTITAPFDTAGLVELTDALIADGFGKEGVGRLQGRMS